jgi:hypothetical protein
VSDFSILDRLPDYDRTIIASAGDMRVFFNELEMHGAYQILVGRREGDRGDMIEIFVTYERAEAP